MEGSAECHGVIIQRKFLKYKIKTSNQQKFFGSLSLRRLRRKINDTSAKEEKLGITLNATRC